MIALCCQFYRDLGKFAESLKCLEKYKVKDRIYNIKGTQIAVLDAKSTNPFHGRNALVYGCLDVPVDLPTFLPFDTWIFFDSDIEWTEEHILMMIENQDDIFSFGYKMRGKEKYNAIKDGQHLDLDTTGRMEIDGCGAGALKFTKKVAKSIPPLLFFPFQQTVNGVIRAVPSDYAFCYKARAKGFKIVCEFDLNTHHEC